MKPGWRRRTLHGLAALVISVAGIVLGAGSASATAEPVGDCTTSSGVILAVDFVHWGGPLVRACGTTPTTGYQLLNEGGWSTQGDNHDGPAFVCRIAFAGYDGGAAFPTPAQDPCIVTPPASAYWSYWHANPGQNTWAYSKLGAMSYQSAPGSVDLWTFGATNITGTTGSGVPSFSPDSVRARNSMPTGSGGGGGGGTGGTGGTGGNGGSSGGALPGASTGQAGGSGGGSGDTSGGVASDKGGSAAAGAANPPTAPGSASSAANTAGNANNETGGSPGSQLPSILNASPVSAAPHSSHGSAFPAILTLVAVCLLGGAGVFYALRRPRSHG